MQISAANLMIAAEQPARAAASNASAAQAKFATALTREGKVEAAAFAPIEFKSVAPTPDAALTAPAPSGTRRDGDAKLGANVDIRV